jgi:NitT/TauT family transport system permease protein
MATWSLRRQLPPAQRGAVEALGLAGVVGIWEGTVWALGLPPTVMPGPVAVVQAVPALLSAGVAGHAAYSVVLNLASYLIAAAVALPVGFAISLFGPIRALLERQLTALRYLPITAFIGVFIFWFGISHLVKVLFLAAGLLVYLLAGVIQRVDEVEAVYVDTAKTCGASRWQRVTTVFMPLALARLSDDLRSLVPITWTYIVIAEGFNLSEGGLGALVSVYTRPHRWDMVFALVAIIALIGFLQDKVWVFIDRRLFRWKYV